MKYHVLLSSFHSAKKVEHAKYSVSRNKPFWCSHPELSFLAPFDSSNKPIHITTYSQYEDELRSCYMRNWDKIKQWLENLDHKEQISLCCWCPHSKPSKSQLKQENNFACHTLLIGKMINKHRPDLIVLCDDDREVNGYRPWLDWYFEHNVELIISGGQTGADQAGLFAAKFLGIKTSGWMPKGFITQSGPRPDFKDLFNVFEHTSSAYPPRTFSNVKDSDATIRFASNFDSPGEKLTLKAIQQYNKPHIDVDVKNAIHYNEVRLWLRKNKIKRLNVAGNAESTSEGIRDFTYNYLLRVFGGK